MLDDERRLTESIGFILIPMRQIPFWNYQKSGANKSRWHKLMGVASTYSSPRPELLLNVMIRSAIDRAESCASSHISEESEIESNRSQKLNFRLSMHLKAVEMADQFRAIEAVLLKARLIHETEFPLEKSENNATHSLNKLLHEELSLTYEEFLSFVDEQMSFSIGFCNGNEQIDSAKIKFNRDMFSLPSTEDDFRRAMIENRCLFSINDCIATNRTGIKLFYSLRLHLSQDDFLAEAIPTLHIPSMTYAETNSTRQTTTVNRNDQENTSHENMPKTFSYNLSLVDCTFSRRPSAGIWQFSLHHENADNPIAMRNIEIGDLNVNQISFEELELKLCFTSSINALDSLIQSKSSLLMLRGPKGTHATAELDNHHILTQDKVTGIVQLRNDVGEQLALAHILVEVVDLGLNFNTQSNQPRENVTAVTTLFDENIAYKMIEELEAWKEHQQRAFMAMLEAQQNERKSRSSNEWERKLHESHSKLKEKSEQCEELQAEMAVMRRRISELETNEKSLLKAKTQVTKESEKKCSVLQKKIQAIEAEMNECNRVVNHLFSY